MSSPNTAVYVGGGALGILLLMLMSKGNAGKVAVGTLPPDENVSDDDVAKRYAAAGFAPGDALERHFDTTSRHGSLYQMRRGDIVLGDGKKSLCWRALKAAAEDADLNDPEGFASSTDRKIAYARLLCVGNEDKLTTDLHPRAFRDDHGRGLNVKDHPVVWLPLLDLEAVALGLVAPAQWEDGSSTVLMPPECRAALEIGP